MCLGDNAMTRDEILNMPAGREMDVLIDQHFGQLQKDSSPIYEMPHYSTDIAAAWEVIEKLCGETGADVVKVCKRDPELLRGDWSCNFGRGFEAFADTAPLAICRAALLTTLQG
jgi:hypothetical protein